MTKTGSRNFSRRALLGAFAASAVVAAPTYASASGYLRGAGDIRRLRMYSDRTGESLDTIYWIDGSYLGEPLADVMHFMRDWRNDQVKSIDSRTLDILAAAHAMLETNEPYMLISGYRSPETNAMLRRRSSGVAKNSRHLRGEAADLSLKSRSVGQMFRAGKAISAGGVGRYTSSGFVHLDSGPVRNWGA
jgi:uncharacterized protein YcbK (DUF882 family)